MSKHTPGPWEIDPATRPAEICTIHGLPRERTEGQGWAYVRGAIGYWDADEEEQLANAHLIAAAPDLLEALTDLLESMDRNGSCQYESLREQARAAISKAKGEQ